MKKEKNINSNELNKEELKLEKKAAKAEKKDSGVAFLMLKIVIALVLVTVVAYFGFACVVREGNAAIILRFGAPRETITEAGLYFKLPWPFETVVNYDNREQYLESNNLETLTKDKQNIILQSYAIWQIEDPLVYHNSVGVTGAVDSYLKNQIFSATNSVMGMYNLTDLISSNNENLKTEEIQNKIFELVKENCEVNYGIKILDLSILRISYPQANLQSIYDKIIAERKGVSDAILAGAQAQADYINSATSIEKGKIEGDAINKAAEIKAETEKEVAAIYAAAQEANLELFTFLKDLDTIVNSVNSNSVLVVNADSYPFNVLLKYGENANEETMLGDLETTLASLSEKDREAVIKALKELLVEAGKQSNSNGETNTPEADDGKGDNSNSETNTPEADDGKGDNSNSETNTPEADGGKEDNSNSETNTPEADAGKEDNTNAETTTPSAGTEES
ncbi:MAG: protease modulator HflC [Ruminococcaceae bacterium]|nr:protease modulator HflC [Oscillospiraceae bacterium]